MPKGFMSQEAAAEKLGVKPEEVSNFVRAGELREFRDAGVKHYKNEDVEALVAKRASGGAQAQPPAEGQDEGTEDESSDLCTPDEAAGFLHIEVAAFRGLAEKHGLKKFTLRGQECYLFSAVRALGDLPVVISVIVEQEPSPDQNST